jgi:hypothetical protein
VVVVGDAITLYPVVVFNPVAGDHVTVVAAVEVAINLISGRTENVLEAVGAVAGPAPHAFVPSE